VGDTLAIAKRTGALVISKLRDRQLGGSQGTQDSRAAHRRRLQTPFGYLKLTLALHGSTMPDGANGGNPAGFLLSTNGRQESVYMAGDTGLFWRHDPDRRRGDRPGGDPDRR